MLVWRRVLDYPLLRYHNLQRFSSSSTPPAALVVNFLPVMVVAQPAPSPPLLGLGLAQGRWPATERGEARNHPGER